VCRDVYLLKLEEEYALLQADYEVQVEKAKKYQSLLSEEVSSHEATKLLLQASETSKFKLLLQASQTSQYDYDSQFDVISTAASTPSQSPSHGHNGNKESSNSVRAGNLVSKENECDHLSSEISLHSPSNKKLYNEAEGDSEVTPPLGDGGGGGGGGCGNSSSGSGVGEDTTSSTETEFKDKFEKLDRPDRDTSGVGWWRWSATTTPQKVGSRLVLRV
jgi:hypothetical protein